MSSSSYQSLIGVLAFTLAMGFGLASAAACQGTVAISPKAASARLVIFGELHGTKEAPDFVRQHICNPIQLKGKVVLGLEVPATSQRALLAQGHWKYNTPDGRSSVAMFELIELVRTQRAIGKPV